MRKVCPQCEGKGTLRINLGGCFINDVACLDCNQTGYIDVPEDHCDEVAETDKTDNL